MGLGREHRTPALARYMVVVVLAAFGLWALQRGLSHGFGVGRWLAVGLAAWLSPLVIAPLLAVLTWRGR